MSSQTPTNKLTSYSLIFVGWFGLVLTVTILFTVWSDYFRDRDLPSWPTTTGIVEGWHLEKVVGDEGSRSGYYPYPSYLYEIEGRAYRGFVTHATNDSDEKRVLKSPEAALKVLASYPIGEGVTVHYDPGRPEAAVLVTESEKTLLGLIGSSLFGVFFAAMSCLFLAAAEQSRMVTLSVGVTSFVIAVGLVAAGAFDRFSYSESLGPSEGQVAALRGAFESELEFWASLPGRTADDLFNKVGQPDTEDPKRRGVSAFPRKNLRYERRPTWERDAVVEIVNKRGRWWVDTVTSPYFERAEP